MWHSSTSNIGAMKEESERRLHDRRGKAENHIFGDPTYITNHNGARSLAGRINRNELLSEIVTAYMEQFTD